MPCCGLQFPLKSAEVKLIVVMENAELLHWGVEKAELLCGCEDPWVPSLGAVLESINWLPLF